MNSKNPFTTPENRLDVLGFSTQEKEEIYARQLDWVNGPAPSTPEPRTGFHTIRGMRVEYNAGTSLLDLWVRPLAGKSVDHFLRNFSNRDDFVSIFSKICFSYLLPSRFEKVNYDPFHTVISYRGGLELHIAQHPDHPALAVWTTQPTVVDIKTDRNGQIFQREAHSFSYDLMDRSVSLTMALALGKGEGEIHHQPATWEKRSQFARIQLAAHQLLVFTSDMATEKPRGLAREAADWGIDSYLSSAEESINRWMSSGQAKLRGWADTQAHENILHVNRRVLMTTMDASGALWDGPKFIYCLLWIRSGITPALMAGTGWTDFLRRWCEFFLSNPSTIEKEQPEGVMFGQLAGPNNKWEEDGLFYATWCAWTYATLTGDSRFLQGTYLSNLLAGLEWLEKECWDEERGLFGRYYRCESAFFGHRDSEWDMACGAPIDWPPPMHEGQRVMRAYDSYINLLCYSIYRMLAPYATGDKRASMLKKADRIAEGVRSFFHPGELPDYGDLLLEDGTTVRVRDWDFDTTDYIWAYTLPPFFPDYVDAQEIARTLLEACTKDFAKSHERFSFFHTIPLLFNDPEWCGEEKIAAFLEKLVPFTTAESKTQATTYGMPEMVFLKPSNWHHDIRPCAFASGQWAPVYYGLGLRKLPMGLSVRGTGRLERIDHVSFMGRTFSLEYTGEGKAHRVIVDGRTYEGSLQLAESLFTKDDLIVRVEASKKTRPGTPLLLSSNLRLLSVQKIGVTFHYRVSGVGSHEMNFDGAIHHVEWVNDHREFSTESLSTPEGSKIRLKFQLEGEAELSVR